MSCCEERGVKTCAECVEYLCENIKECFEVYRDHVAAIHEISCSGCKPENWCRYRVVRCCEERGVKTCAECEEYLCENIKECFEVTRSFEPKCREVCTEDEYERLKKAFFEKEKNLSEINGDYRKL